MKYQELNEAAKLRALNNIKECDDFFGVVSDDEDRIQSLIQDEFDENGEILK